MQRLEHDMDELSQKAAENYPLKPGDSNWETIASRLTDNPVGIKKPARSTVNRKKYLLAAILLLAALLLTDIVLRYNDERGSGSVINREEKGSRQENKQAHSNTRIDEDEVLSSDISVIPTTSQYQNDPVEKKFIETEYDFQLINERYYDQVAKADKIATEPANMIRTDLLTIKGRSSPITEVKKANNIFNQRNEKGFYWGLLAGPQFSEVKQQGMERSGFDAGVLAGYRLNKNLAIESGLFFSAKYYYSDAQYFKMAPDPTMPANMVLMDLRGRSNVMEIPIKLRYDFINKPSNKFFTTAGLSSYLLTKENNNYHAMVNGTENYMEKSYKENSVYGAASVNIGAGFEHRIVNQMLIRLEPYLQIPVKGIGVGSMPVTSAGIHIGIITNKRKR